MGFGGGGESKRKESTQPICPIEYSVLNSSIISKPFKQRKEKVENDNRNR